MPSPDDIRAWAAACGHPEIADDLLDLLADVQTVHRRWKRRLRAALPRSRKITSGGVAKQSTSAMQMS